jgi:hypothetical protein
VERTCSNRTRNGPSSAPWTRSRAFDGRYDCLLSAWTVLAVRHESSYPDVVWQCVSAGASVLGLEDVALARTAGPVSE